MQKQYILTDEGLKKLEAELEELTTVKRTEIAEKIEIARSFGDLSENSEYDEAKNEQAIVEARIADLEAMLRNVRVLDEEEINASIIHVGSKVRAKDLEFDEIVDYQIVGSSETDPMNNKISDESPVGSAMIGHAAGEVVEVETPGGMVKFEILEVSR
ncbi:MAG: transcription elongation factor GreA [Clostridiales bacterium]|nr:transcription elongation factor GreA [Clostridiales bacterium]